MSESPHSRLPDGVRLSLLRFGPIFQYRLWGGCHLEEPELPEAGAR